MALLYGTVGLQNYNVYNGAITENSERGPLFFTTKDLNERCHHLGKTLMALTSVGVFHSPEVLEGKEQFEQFRQPISDSEVLACKKLPKRCSVGEFVDVEGNRYIMVQNRDYNEIQTFTLKLKKKFRIYEVSQENGKQFVKSNGTKTLDIKLQPGCAALLRCQDANEEKFLIDYVLKK